MKNHYRILMLSSLLSLIIVLLNSCSPRVTTFNNVYIPDYNADLIDYSAEQTIVRKKDLFGLAVEYRGAIMVDQPHTYLRRRDCNEEIAMQKLQMQAANVGATLINIISEIKPGETKPPYDRSACYRCMAELYKMGMDSITQRVLNQPVRVAQFLIDDDTLSWQSFMQMDSTEIPLKYFVNLYAKAGRVSVWTGKFKDFKVVPVFYNDISKVESSFATDDNLNVLHHLVKITKFHAAKTEFQLNDKTERSKLGSIQEIIESNLLNLTIEQESFLKETDYGRDKVAMKKWIAKH